MKNIKNQAKALEAIEIGSLILELIEKGMNLKIETDITSNLSPHTTVSVWVGSNPAETFTWRTGLDIVEVLGSLVDTLRKNQGEPTREQEVVSAMIEKQNAITGLPGNGVCAACGSSKPLIVETKLIWDETAQAYFADVNNIFNQLAKCSNCGQYSKLQKKDV